MKEITYKPSSIRSFIGAKNYDESRKFYCELGFKENVIGDTMSYFQIHENQGFYLQKYYVKRWVDNSMLFLEVKDLDQCYLDIENRNLVDKYDNVRLSEIKTLVWGREFFLHDPSGILWHFGNFND